MENIPQKSNESSKQEQEGRSIISRIRNKTTKKIMGFLAGLTLAINAEASVSNLNKALDTEPEKAGGPKKEFADMKAKDTQAELTSQYEGSFEKFLEIDFTNYFDTDDAGLEGDNKLEIEKEFEEFLSGINTSTIDNILESDFVIYSSCDERPSAAFDSNLDLSLARSESIKQVLQEALDNFDFSKTDLTDEQVSALKAKGFQFDYPAFPGAEPGVVPLDKEAEIFGEDATKHLTKDELYSLVRMTRFELRIPVDVMDDVDQDVTPEVENVEQKEDSFAMLVKLIKQDGTNVLLFDKSGSMHDDIDALAEKVQDYKDVKVGSFSNHFDGIADIQDKEDIEKVMSGGASTKERALHSLQEFLNSYSQNNSVEGLNVIIVTDEAIQDISLAQIEQVKKETAEHGVSVSFILRDGGEKVVSLDDIEQTLLSNEKYQKEIQKLEEDLKEAEQKRDAAKDRDVKEMWERTVKQCETKIQAMNTKSFTLSSQQF